MELFGIGLAAFWVFGLIVIGVFTSIFWIVEIIDIVRRQFRDPILKIVWLVIVCFSHIIGALIYYFIGKRDGILPGETQYGR